MYTIVELGAIIYLTIVFLSLYLYGSFKEFSLSSVLFIVKVWGKITYFHGIYFSLKEDGETEESYYCHTEYRFSRTPLDIHLQVLSVLYVWRCIPMYFSLLVILELFGRFALYYLWKCLEYLEV